MKNIQITGTKIINMNALDDKKIRPEKMDNIRARLYNQDLKKIDKKKLLKINCPVCNSKKYKLWTRKMGFNFVICQKCETLFINPKPNEHDLKEFYKNSKSMVYWNEIFRETETIRKEKIFKPRVKLIKKILQEYGVFNCKTMIEVGAGYGWFCELSKKMKLSEKIIAIEPSHMQAESCKKIKGIKVVESTFEEYKEKENPDLIVSFEVLHLLYNPKLFLENCHNQLKQGGIFICTMTNFDGLDIQILKNESDYIVPTFLTIFNPNSIRFLLKKIGFKKIEITTPGLLDAHIIMNKIKSGKIKKQNPFFEFLINSNDEKLTDSFQKLIIKHKKSSHMLIVCQK